MYAMLTRSLIEEGCNRLDFSSGLEEYKLRLGASVEPVFRFVLWHNRSRLKRWNLLSQVRSAKSFAARAKYLLRARFASESEDERSSAR
jgi:CelD/BcsL family acetyltransferase involved in cellulose biosynthesis